MRGLPSRGERVDEYVVTGGTGFLGRHLVSTLEAAGHTAAVPRSASCDLLQLAPVQDFLARERPDRIIHSAAYYGGLGINVVEPATTYLRDVMMGASLFEAARQVDTIPRDRGRRPGLLVSRQARELPHSIHLALTNLYSPWDSSRPRPTHAGSGA